MTTSNFDPNAFSQKVTDEFQKARRDIVKPNILVAGATGAGKSALVNLVFGDDVARVGVGAPVTQGVDRYEFKNLILYDAEGYEAGADNQARYKKTLEDLLKGQVNKHLSEKIHLVWYCISQASHRLQEIDTQTVSALASHGVPVAIIMTQADAVSEADSEALRAVIQKKCCGIPLFQSSTNPKLLLDINDLIQWSIENLESGVRTAFMMAARSALPQRYREGQKIVNTSAAAAALIAATPIPLADAPFLMMNQARMIGQLSVLWDLEALTTLISGGLALQLVSQLGRTASGSLIKLIPGYGTVAGGAINASIASAFTAAMGHALNEICLRFVEASYRGEAHALSDYLSGDIIRELMESYFAAQKETA